MKTRIYVLALVEVTDEPHHEPVTVDTHGESAMVGGGASPMKVIRRFNKTEGGGA